MGQNAVQSREFRPESTRSLRLIIGGKALAQTTTLPRDIVILGVILATLQVIDGVLTGLGMHWYGTSMEGNALLRALMHVIGYIPALILVKGFSIGLTGLLCAQAPRMSWLKPAFYGVIALYVFGAVVPWSYIILSDLLA